MMHHAGLVVALSLSACGLERDWERWQQASQSGTEDTGSSDTSTTTPQDSSSSSPAGADSSSSSSGASDDASSATVDDTTTTADPSTSTGTTVTWQPFCGDGHVDPDLLEECDDGEVVSDACVLCQRPRLIFLTSTLLKGGTANFGDSDAVDAGWIDLDIVLNPDSDCTGNRPIYCAEQE